MKFNSKQIFDYIVGNEIPDYELEQLENDHVFMLEIFKLTKDKRIYNLCSEEIKQDYELIKGLISIFPDDLEFLEQVCDTFLKERTTFSNITDLKLKDIQDRELIIRMNNHLTSKGIKNHKYQILANLIYESLISEFEKYKQLEDDEKIQNILGKGFFLYKEIYDSSSLITDFIAKKMSEEIFYSNDELRFEDLIHKYYKNKNITSNIGINNFIIAYINIHDTFLADYISTKLNLTNDIKKNIQTVEKNWDKYLEIINKRKIEIFYQDVFSTMKDYEDFVTFDIINVINYVIEKLHLEELFEKYDLSPLNFFESDYEYSPEYERLSKDLFTINPKNLNLMEYKYLKELLIKTKKLFSEEILEVTYDDYEEKSPPNIKGQIIKMTLCPKHKNGSS